MKVTSSVTISLFISKLVKKNMLFGLYLNLNWTQKECDVGPYLKKVTCANTPRVMYIYYLVESTCGPVKMVHLTFFL